MSSKISLCCYNIGHLGLRNETKLVLSCICVLLGFTQMSYTPQAFAQGGGGGGVIPPTTPVGGIFEGVDTLSLLLNYAILNAIWMAPIGIGIGVGIYLVKRKL